MQSNLPLFPCLSLEPLFPPKAISYVFSFSVLFKVKYDWKTIVNNKWVSRNVFCFHFLFKMHYGQRTWWLSFSFIKSQPRILISFRNRDRYKIRKPLTPQVEVSKHTFSVWRLCECDVVKEIKNELAPLKTLCSVSEISHNRLQIIWFCFCKMPRIGKSTKHKLTSHSHRRVLQRNF